MARNTILGFALTLLSTSSAWGIPHIINFQGRLSDSGVPVAGARAMTFNIYDTPAGGSLLFSEAYAGSKAIMVSSGNFNALVGSLTPGGIPLGVFDGADRFIEVQVGTQILSRQRIVSVGYAFRSERASFSDQASTAAFAQRAASAASVDDATVINMTTITATMINVTSITVNSISVTSASVQNAMLVGGGVKVGHSIILGTVAGTPGADNTITFDNGPGVITAVNPGAGPLTLATVDANPIILTPGGNVGIGTTNPSAKLDVAGGLIASGQANTMTGGLKLYNATSSNATTLRSGSATTAVTYTLPLADGLPGQVLATDGSGNLSWIERIVAGNNLSIISINPTTGPVDGGIDVTISGTGFQSGATVSIGGVSATNVIVSPTQIAARTPSNPPGSANVSITNPNGLTTTLVAGFSYFGMSLVSVSPSTGSMAGGTSISLFGIGFMAGANVTIGGILATNITVHNSTLITATTPPRPNGPADVRVTNPNNLIATLVGGFTYFPPITNGCADGTEDQIFLSGQMVGCNGITTYQNSASLCGPGWHLCSLQEYAARKNGVFPANSRFIQAPADGTFSWSQVIEGFPPFCPVANPYPGSYAPNTTTHEPGQLNYCHTQFACAGSAIPDCSISGTSIYSKMEGGLCCY